MQAYKQKSPYTTALYLLVPEYRSVKGVKKKEYKEAAEDMIFFASFKTFGGTESTTNSAYTVIDTALIETWYRPDIKSDCAIMRACDGAVYEIIGEPENIDMRNQVLKFKVRRVKGGV